MLSEYRFIFKPVEAKDRLLVHKWLVQPHVAEWIHGVGLQNTLNGLEKFFQGESDTTYWICYDKNIPFAFLITSPEGNDATTLDLFICDLNYLGKGIAVPMIREFLISQFPNVKRVLIDPEATNKRAIHVYKKVGFKIIGEFIASWHPVPHYQMELYMKDLLKLKTKKIVVTPYNSDWPKIFDVEASKIKETLGSNCIAIHHIGSTSVPGLLAKPVIDMIGVIKDPEKAIKPLEDLGFKYKGEYNIPMRFYFNKSEGIEANLHVYEEGHPEIELNLTFRDYLRIHPDAREEYSKLKENLLKEKSSYEKNKSLFTGYNLGKDAFIRKILQKANFNRIRMMKCTHYAEWEVAKQLRNKYFFDPLSISDPYTWTFDHPEHAHLVLYQGVEIIGYAHIQFWPNHRAALRIIVIDDHYRYHGSGSYFLNLCEQWLKKQGVKSLHDEARPDVVNFYRKNGFVEMPFNDPSGEPPSIHDLAMGKLL